MSTKEARLKANMKYQAANTTQIKFTFNHKTDADILTKLESVGNKQGYIKALIRADIAQEAGSADGTQESPII